MNRSPLLAIAAALLLGSSAAHAQLSITWSTIDNGGGACSTGALALNCTIGQPDAGPMMSGGALTLTGGFWAAAGPSGPHCGSADFNCDGAVGTDADIESFFACLSGACPPPPCTSTADFNGDGALGTDADIEAFFRVLAGGPC
jgi:hypothetical protein